MSTVGLCFTSSLQPWDAQAIKELTTLAKSYTKYYNKTKQCAYIIIIIFVMFVRTSPTLFMKFSLPFSVESLFTFTGEGAAPSIMKTRLTPAE